MADANLNAVAFQLVVASSVKCGRGWCLPSARWPDHRLMFIRGGQGRLALPGGGERELRRGHLLFGLPGECYGVFQNERKRLLVSVVRFHALNRRGRKVALKAFRPELCTAPDCFPMLEPLALALTEGVSAVPGTAPPLPEAILRLMLWFLREGGPTGGVRGMAQVAFQELKPALDYPVRPGQREPTVEELAGLCGLSPSTFRRRMWECHGGSPKQVMLWRRMERAKGLLLESPYSVEAIARELGYSEPGHFSRQFKRLVGVTPAAFRTSNQ